MNRFIRIVLGLVATGAASFAHAQACTVNVNPGGGLQAALNAAPSNSVVCLAAGTYTPDLVGFPANGAFAIGRNITVRGADGTTPAQVVLQGGAAADHAVYFVNYLGGATANFAQLRGVTIQGSQGGIQIFNFPDTPGPFTRITDVKIKDVVINTPTVGCCFGFKSQSADRVVLDNVTITSHMTAINLIDTTDSVVMNSTVTNTIAQNAAALSVLGGSGNRILSNTFGAPRTTAGAPYSFNGGSVVFYNTSENRFENNVVQGMRDDAVDFTVTDLAVNGIPLQRARNNYVGKNLVQHSDFPVDGQVLGSSGIWANCASDLTWIYGNESTGNAECGVCVWGSKSSMVLGNKLWNNGITGAFVSSGQEALDTCAPAGNLSFRQKAVSNFVMSNGVYFNRNDQIVTRNADLTEISRNHLSPKSGFGGTNQSCTNPACQAAYSIEVDASQFNTSTGTRILANTNVENARGIWVDSTSTTGIDFFRNRTINSVNSRLSSNVTTNIDRGATLGGNYWTMAPVNGNPSNGTQPYAGVFHNTSNNTGNVVDRFPYQSENMGRGFGAAGVFEPRAGALVSRGTKRTVRWDAPGCVWIDFDLDGTTSLGANQPNTGYAVVTIPAGTATGSRFIRLTCRDAAGTSRGTFNSSTFTVTSDTLRLVSPGRDDTFNASQQLWVTWANANSANASVSIDYSTDGGSNWSNLSTVSSISATNPVTSTRVTLPATVTSRAMMRVRSGGSTGAPGTIVDETDGVFAVRGGAGGLTNVAPGRNFQMGLVERLEWTSPANSKLVTITAQVGGAPQVIADLPDRGFYDWIPADLGPGAVTITLQFKNIEGTNIGGAVVNGVAGNMRYPTNITFGSPPTITPPGNGTLTASTNSGAAVTLTPNTPAVCTVSGSTVTGVVNGTCTITGNAGASGNFLAAPASTISFAIGQTQTITFNSPGNFLAVGSSLPLSATASSGLAVTFSSLTPSVCSVSGSTVTGNTVGACTVAANQTGNGSFAAAQEVTRALQAVAAADIPRLVNISTRMQVLTGQDVLIGGLIIGGNQPKTVVVRARGPSLIPLGVPNAIANPVLQLFSGSTQIDANDNWQEHPSQATLLASGFAPSNAFESAIYTTLNPGGYTAIVTGAGATTGVGIIEVFEVNLPQVPLLNIATRGQVLTGGDVMIAGFIIQGTQAQTVAVRARGPSLAAAGVVGPLQNPRLQLFSGPTEIASNDDWQTAGNSATVLSSGFAPSDTRESVILITLNPGAYTAIVTGVGGTTGVAIVEVFGF